MPSITEINRFARLSEARADVRDLAIAWPLVHLFELAPFSTVVVAGAHEGKVIDLLDTTYHGCYILGYEPIMEFVEQAIQRLHGRDNIVIVQRALSDSVRPIQLAVDGVFTTAMNTIKPHTRDAQVVDIADMVHEPRIDLLLLNVEGFEGRLLRRLHETGDLEAGIVPRVVVQFHEQYDDFSDVMLDMVDAGYQKVYDDYPRWVYWKHKDA